MRKIIGSIFIFLGTLLILSAVGLLLYNRAEAASAEQSSRELLPVLVEEIIKQQEEPQQPQNAEAPEEPTAPKPAPVYTMQEIEINGHSYIGVLSIPTLELELPIMADWNYTKLRIAPCRYHGTVLGEDLVIMAHNYARHFGRLSELQEGDVVTFIDVTGIATDYEMIARDVLMPNAVEEMTAGDYDLTLFTCTYGGKSRVTVYFDRVKANNNLNTEE
jgi:sortase A